MGDAGDYSPSSIRATFDLLPDAADAEEEAIEKVDLEDSNIFLNRPKAQSLRTVSLPQPSDSGQLVDSTLCSHSTGAKLSQAAAASTVSLAAKDSAAKPKKVSQYYKKQNELIENFKNDSEQIEQFKRTRRRTTSNNEEEVRAAPIVRHPEEADEPEVVVVDRTSLLDVRASKSGETDDAKGNDAKDAKSSAARLAMVTLAVNVSLMLAKAAAAWMSGSISIISSMVDSLVDITSGVVISISEYMIRKRDPYLYPRGRTRLEPLSLILISVIMGMASVQLIISSVSRIHNAVLFHVYGEGHEPGLELPWTSVAIMVSTVVVKLFLFLVCKRYKDPSVSVLAMDHRNDCISNSVALLCSWLGTRYSYYFDPTGAILVSLYILYTWVQTGWEHLAKLSGRTAEPEFINRIIKVCLDHDPRISHIDTVYVYHFGSKFLVEVHIVLDENMRLKVAHDISEALQSNIESLPEVERAFVHTDYDYQHHPNDEHKAV